MDLREKSTSSSITSTRVVVAIFTDAFDFRFTGITDTCEHAQIAEGRAMAQTVPHECSQLQKQRPRSFMSSLRLPLRNLKLSILAGYSL